MAHPNMKNFVPQLDETKRVRHGLGTFFPQPFHRVPSEKERQTDYEAQLSPELRAFYRQHVCLTKEQAEKASQQTQGTPGWDGYRALRLTMSNASKSTKHHPFAPDCTDDLDALAEEMVFGEVVQNQAMLDGNKREEPARQRLLRILRDLLRTALKESRAASSPTFLFADHIFPVPAQVLSPEQEDLYLTCKVSGIHIDPERPWMGVSSDMDIYLFGVLIMIAEIKNPKDLYGLPPLYYYDQCMGSLLIRKLPAVWFYVQAPDGESYTLDLFCYDKSYLEDFMEPMMKRFYFMHLLPALYRRFQKQQQASSAASSSKTV